MRTESIQNKGKIGDFSEFPTAISGMNAAEPQTGRTNRVRIILDDGKLHISGENVDLKGVDKLKRMLAKYEEILKLSELDEEEDDI